MKAQSGDWDVFLTPCIPVPKAWFGPLLGADVLGLASGGGQQMPLLTAAGAACTVFDISDAQLKSERAVADREGYSIKIVKGDMSKTLPFKENQFDIVFHPVSNCYVEDIAPLWQECYRVLKPGGILLAGFDNGMGYLFEDHHATPLTVTNKLPYNALEASEKEYQRMVDQHEGIQFSHSIEEQIGGQLKAGFTLLDLYEDRDRDGLLREFMPQYIATRASKPVRSNTSVPL